MSRTAEILELRGRIRRKQAERRSVFREVERLRLLVLDELEETVARIAEERARERREPGSFQRELELDDE